MLYVDPTWMIQGIRAHVLQYGHEVIASDDPINRYFGYLCMGCANGVEVSPQTRTWHILVQDIGVLEASTLCREGFRGLLTSRVVRDRLTWYLNGFRGDFDMGPRVQVADRYHRPWVI